MQVSAAPFYVFLVAVCLLYWVAAGSRQLRLSLLALANLYFLAHFSIIYLALPLCATTDFLIGFGLGSYQGKAVRRLLVFLSVLINVGVLATLKLLPLFSGSHWQWLFPLSLSFYCFQ